MALENNFSWTTLASMLDEMTPTLSKTKQMVKVLLEVLQKLQKKHLEMPKNNVQQNDMVDYQKDEEESTNKDIDLIEDSETHKIGSGLGNQETNVELTGEKLYKCKYCQKSFRKSDNLKCHERIHTGEVPYECMKCKKRFSNLTYLKNHEITYHTKKKSFECNLCRKKVPKEKMFRRRTITIVKMVAKTVPFEHEMKGF